MYRIVLKISNLLERVTFAKRQFINEVLTCVYLIVSPVTIYLVRIIRLKQDAVSLTLSGL